MIDLETMGIGEQSGNGREQSPLAERCDRGHATACRLSTGEKHDND